MKHKTPKKKKVKYMKNFRRMLVRNHVSNFAVLIVVILIFGLLVFFVASTTKPHYYAYTDNQFQKLESINELEKWSKKSINYISSDLDGDKIEDLIIKDRESQKVFINYGGLGEFETPESSFSNSGQVLAGDLDADGQNELLLADESTNMLSIKKVNQSSREVVDCGEINLSIKDKQLYSGDFDGDAYFDILVRDPKSGVVQTFSAKNNTCFNFDYHLSEVLPSFNTTQSAKIVVGDYNGDTFSDILVHDFENQKEVNYILFGANLAIMKPYKLNVDSAESMFSSAQIGIDPYVKSTNLSLNLPNSIYSADINGDLVDDIIHHNHETGAVQIFQNTDKQTLAYQETKLSIGKYNNLIFGKFNLNNEKNVVNNELFTRLHNIPTSANAIVLKGQKSDFVTFVGAAPGDPTSGRVGQLTSSGGRFNLSATPAMNLTNPRQGSEYSVGDFNGDKLDDILRIEPELNVANMLPGGKQTVTETLRSPLTADSVESINLGVANATVVANITVTEPSGIGYVTVFPCSSGRDTTSVINYSTGQTIAAGIFAQTDENGNVCLYSQATTHFIWDNIATISPAITSKPIRKFDSRLKQPDGFIGPITSNQEKKINVGAENANKTIIGTLTITQAATNGFARIYPCGSKVEISNVNFGANQNIANSYVTKANASGDICFLSNATTHAIVDVVGATNGIMPLETPIRDIDTRQTQKVTAGNFLRLKIKTTVTNGKLLVGNLTFTDIEGVPGQLGHATVWPCDSQKPLFSNINFTPGVTIANLAVTSLNSNNEICIFTTASAHIIWDSMGTVEVASVNAQKRIKDSRFIQITSERASFDTKVTISNLNIKRPYRFVSGDFNGDGMAESLVFQPGTTDEDFYITYDKNANSLTKCTVPFSLVGEGYYPYSGDFNGDNVDDFVMVFPDAESSKNVFYAGKSGASLCNATLQPQQLNIQVQNFSRLAVGDFDGDGADDILSYNARVYYDNDNKQFPADEFIYFGQKGQFGPNVFAMKIPTIDTSEYQVLAGDFIGDNRDEIIWYRVNGGSSYIWSNIQKQAQISGVGVTEVVLSPSNTYFKVKSSDAVGAKYQLVEIADRNAISAWDLSPLWPPCSNGMEPNIETGECPKGAFNTNGKLPIPPQYPQRQANIAPNRDSTNPIANTGNVTDTEAEGRLANYINNNPVIMAYWNSLAYQVYVDTIDDTQWANIINTTNNPNDISIRAAGLARAYNGVFTANNFKAYTSQVYIRVYGQYPSFCHDTQILHELAHAEQYNSGRYTRQIDSSFGAPAEIDADLRVSDIIGIPYAQMKDWYLSRCQIFFGYPTMVLNYLQTQSQNSSFAVQSVTNTNIEVDNTKQFQQSSDNFNQ